MTADSINAKIKTVVSDPIKGRIAYDLAISSFVIGVIYVVFRFADIPNIAWYYLPLFPLAFICANTLLGVYSRFKMAAIRVKSVILTLSAVIIFALFVVITGATVPLLLATMFLIPLAIAPRLFTNLNKSLVIGKYYSNIANDKNPIVVVGGGGYIGSHVVEKLLREGKKVRVFDKFLYGREVLDDLKNNKNLEIIEGDISDLYSLTLALQDAQAVIHLAGIVGDPACALDDDLTQHINIVSTRMLKETVKAFRIPKFIFASSCSVYGATDKKVNEKSKLNPVSLYARSKIDSENELLNDPFDEFHPTILRFATVFGHSRRPRFDLVANLFTAQAYNNGEITVTGSNQWRPFIHVSDVAEAVVRTALAPVELIDRQIFNVGDDRLNVTIGSLAKTVARTVNTSKNNEKVKILTNDDITDRRNYNVSFAKIHKVLGFKAKVTLAKGVAEINENFRQNTYKKPHTDPYYSNVEMTKQLQKEFMTEDYRHSHFTMMYERVSAISAD